MSDNANAVQDALEGVLDGEAEPQSANEPSPDVADALKDALGDPKDDKSASDDPADDKSADDTDKGSKKVPYERLSQVVKQKNEVTERLKALDEQFKSATARENELRERVGQLEGEKEILDAIKNLAQDERYRPHVEKLDRALQGLDEEVEQAQEQGDKKAENAALKKFEEKAAELDDLMADQRAESLWNEAHGRAREMLAALPEVYTDEDRAVLGKLWTPNVDWNAIEAAGREAIPEALNTSFAAVIKEYGTPRGALVKKTTEEIEARVPEAKIVSPEDKVKELLAKEWGARDEDGAAVHSEAEFNAGLAEMIRKTRGE
jgi:hypothetical protein